MRDSFGIVQAPGGGGGGLLLGLGGRGGAILAR